MKSDLLITDDTCALIVEWVVAHPDIIDERDQQEFFRGLFWICDEAIRWALESERHRAMQRVRQTCSQ